MKRSKHGACAKCALPRCSGAQPPRSCGEFVPCRLRLLKATEGTDAYHRRSHTLPARKDNLRIVSLESMIVWNASSFQADWETGKGAGQSAQPSRTQGERSMGRIEGGATLPPSTTLAVGAAPDVSRAHAPRPIHRVFGDAGLFSARGLRLFDGPLELAEAVFHHVLILLLSLEDVIPRFLHTFLDSFVVKGRILIHFEE